MTSPIKGENIIKFLAGRTKNNLKILKTLQDAEYDDVLKSIHEKDPSIDAKIYEVTQLINSMLGLFVFPKEEYLDKILQSKSSILSGTIQDLAKDGWPIPRVVDNYPQAKDPAQLIGYMRNAFSHFNLELTTDQPSDGKPSIIKGLIIWNTPPNSTVPNWKAEVTIEEIEIIVEKFADIWVKETT
jgi:hypothetical protein